MPKVDRVAALVVLVLLVVAAASPADAGSTGAQPDAKIAKRKNGPYQGGGIVKRLRRHRREKPRAG